MANSSVIQQAFTKVAAAVFLCALVCFGFSARAADTASPAATTSAFYQWYLHSLVADHVPLTDDRAELAGYVSASLIKEIEQRMQSEDGLDADYFIQAQDYHDDWENNISVTKATVAGNAATVFVTLGASKESRQCLALTLKKEDRAWKIRKVRQQNRPKS